MKRIVFAVVVCLSLFVAAGHVATAATVTTLYSFTGSDGAHPHAGLVQGTNGNFYGTTINGGPHGGGTVFMITPSGILTNLYAFNATDGLDPEAELVLGSDGNFYGTTASGGPNNFGTVFRMTPDGTLTTLHLFSGPGHTADGESPNSALVEGTNGNFYGTTQENAIFAGTVFEMTPSGNLTNLFKFTATSGVYTNGYYPNGLVLGTNGNFYGTTQQGGVMGGTNGQGTVFEMMPDGNLTNLNLFGTSVGAPAFPGAALVLGSDGNFYGTSHYGGTNNLGAVFRMSPDGQVTTLYSFSATDGNAAGGTVSRLVEGNDGNFYGTVQGGAGTKHDSITNHLGTVFRISPTGTYTNLYFFSGVDGLTPQGPLLGFNGDFYGTTLNGGATYGGTNDFGTVFKFSPGATPCSFSIDPTNAVFSASGGLSDVTVTASATECVWSASSNDGFITITSGTNGAGNGTVNYSVAANAGANQRTGTLTIAGHTFTVAQDGLGCNFALSPTNQSFSASAGTNTVTVTALDGCAWSAVSNDGFITITDGSSGTGSGTVDYSVAANDGSIARTGTLTIAGLTFTVLQGAPGQASADLALSKTGEPTSVIMDSNLTYSLVVTNLGPDTAASVTVTDALPASVSFVSASPGCTNIAGTVVCGLGDLASGDSITKIVVVSPSTIGIITNSAVVSSTTPDPNGANNTASAVSTVSLLQADVGIGKSGSPGTVGVGSNLTYTVTVTNKGPTTATGVTVTDPLPSSAAFVSASPGCTNNGGTVTCGLGDLGNGLATSIQIVVIPNTAGSITNTATVSSNEADPVSANNTARAVTTINSGGQSGGSLTGTLSGVKQKCKTKNNVTTCTLSGLLTLRNGTATDVAPTRVRFFLSPNTTFHDGSDRPLGEATSKTIKAGKTGKLKLKGTPGASGSGQFILAVDDDNQVLASVQVP